MYSGTKVRGKPDCANLPGKLSEIFFLFLINSTSQAPCKPPFARMKCQLSTLFELPLMYDSKFPLTCRFSVG